MTRVLGALVLGATMALTSVVAFADNNSAMNRQPPRNVIEQPPAITLEVGVVSGAPGQYHGPWYEQRLDNREPHGGR